MVLSNSLFPGSETLPPSGIWKSVIVSVDAGEVDADAADAVPTARADSTSVAEATTPSILRTPAPIRVIDGPAAYRRQRMTTALYHHHATVKPNAGQSFPSAKPKSVDSATEPRHALAAGRVFGVGG